ncbi:MAG: transglycosylase SLT domain-containing protein [Spirochaetales bacterium]|nr:transglycosylase SLT domain-containing protein [Spirochaetales bacterium]
MTRKAKIYLIVALPLFFACTVSGRNEVSSSYKSEEFFSLEKQPLVEPVIEGDPGLFFYRNPDTRNSVVTFYTAETGKRIIAETILQAAEEYDIPLSLAFSLCKAESGYNPRAVNVNENSLDRGLFQLNSNSFPDLAVEDFFSVEVNVLQGIRYLRYCLDTGENELVALAMYNAGHQRVKTQGAPVSTLEYISRIITFREAMEEKFLAEFKKNSPEERESDKPRLVKAVQPYMKSVQ